MTFTLRQDGEQARRLPEGLVDGFPRPRPVLAVHSVELALELVVGDPDVLAGAGVVGPGAAADDFVPRLGPFDAGFESPLRDFLNDLVAFGHRVRGRCEAL